LRPPREKMFVRPLNSTNKKLCVVVSTYHSRYVGIGGPTIQNSLDVNMRPCLKKTQTMKGVRV
jgi:hypothetical protein